MRTDDNVSRNTRTLNQVSKEMLEIKNIATGVKNAFEQTVSSGLHPKEETIVELEYIKRNFTN